MTDEYEQNKWRKRPVEITAQRMAEPFEVETMEGTMRGKAGDWLITGVQGEQYPCADAIFRQTYEPAGAAECRSVLDDSFAAVRARMGAEIFGDPGLLATYQANVAMLLHDRYGVTDFDQRNEAAVDVLRLIFLDAKPTDCGSVGGKDGEG